MSNGSSKLQQQSTKHETQQPNSIKKADEGGQEEEEYDEEYEYEDDELVKPNKDALMYEDAITNLQNIKKNEREELSKLEEDNEILRTINDKSKILEYNKNAQPYGPQKTNRKMDIEEDKKVYKLRMQNQVMTEQLQAINHQIDLYVKNHLK